MIHYYLKSFFRNLAKNRGFALINLLGLSIGLMLGILIMTYVANEISYDKHIDNSENKYRLISKFIMPDFTLEGEISNGGLVEHLLADFPDVKNAAAILERTPKISYKENVFFEEDGGVFYAHKGVFDLFSLEFLQGNANQAFNEPFSAVISESFAEKYFGQEDPMNKVLLVDDNYQIKVNGVFKDQPVNTHVQFEMLIPMEGYMSINNLQTLKNLGNQFVIYVEMGREADNSYIVKELERLSYSFVPERMRAQLNAKMEHYFQPMEDIHLYTNFENNSEDNSRVNYIYIFSAIAMFIIFLACINFMNLSTAQYSKRAKEVGVKKVFGSGRKKLVHQFLSESLLISFLSLVNALVFAEILLPVFNRLVEKDLSIISVDNIPLIIGFVVLTFLVGIISGSYPAFFLSRYKAMNIFRGKVSKGSSAKYFRWPMVIFQFTIALILISVTLLIYSQLNYVKNKDLGFDKTQVLTIPLRTDEVVNSINEIKNELAAIPTIKNMTVSSNKPGVGLSVFQVINFEDETVDQHPPIPTVGIDQNFFELFHVKFIEGRNFSNDYKTDSNAVIVNKTLVDYIGWEGALDKKVYEFMPDIGEKVAYNVVGVVDDFHMQTLHKKIEPMVFKYGQWPWHLMLKISGENQQETIGLIEAIWNKYSPSKPFKYSFLNEEYNNQYHVELKFAEIIIYFTIFAIFIAALGMVGLISFITASRTKEIGIRRVLGSNTSQVMKLITIDFIKMILISMIISSPIAYFAMGKWMERFAYKINIHIGYFLIAGGIAIFIAMLSIVYQTYKSANKNPIEAIRYE